MRVERVLTGLVPAWAVACAVLLASLGPCGIAAKRRIQARGRQGCARCRRPRAHPLHRRPLEEGRRACLRARQSLPRHRRCARRELPDAGRASARRSGGSSPPTVTDCSRRARRASSSMSSGPFLIDKAFVLEARDDQPARLVVDLVPTDEKTFLAKLKETKPPQTASAAPSAACATAVAPRRREARGGVGPRPWRRRSRAPAAPPASPRRRSC